MSDRCGPGTFGKTSFARWFKRVFASRRAAEDGFTVIEVLAALSLLAIVTAGAVPLFISGLRASLASKFETQAKNLAQERLEVMRNLPFYVVSSKAPAPSSCWADPGRTNPLDSSGAVECDYKDLLDTYYRSAVQVASSTTAGGYVGTTANRSADEIEAGLVVPYYRFVLNPVPNFQEGRYSQVVLTQFLNASRQVLVPGSTYNTQNSNTDLPPSRLVGVTVITRWTLGSTSKKYVNFSQITEGASEPTTVTLAAEATALRLRTGLDISNAVQIEAEAGISTAGGAVAGGANASTRAQGGWAGLAPGDRVDGKYTTASAPPSTTFSGGTAGSITLTAGSPAFTAASLASTSTGNNVTAGIVAQQPAVPIADPGTNYSTGSLLRSAASNDFSFTNAPPESLTGMPALDPNKPMVSSKVTGGGSEPAGTGRTYVKAQPGTTHFAEAGATSFMQLTRFLPTTFAPEGVVQVELMSSSITCKTTGVTTLGTTSSFTARVKYFTSAGVYVTLEFLGGGANALPNPADLVVNASPEYRLSHYIRDWGVLSNATTTIASGGDSVSSSLNGIVRLTTQNTRPAQASGPDDASAISANIGVLSCSAEDRRT